MMKPDNWVGYLNGIKINYIVDEERKEISRQLFGDRMPLIPKVISQNSEKERDNNADNLRKGDRIHQSGDLRPLRTPSPRNYHLSHRRKILVKNAISRDVSKKSDMKLRAVSFKDKQSSTITKLAFQEIQKDIFKDFRRPVNSGIPALKSKKKRIHKCVSESESSQTNLNRKRKRKKNKEEKLVNQGCKTFPLHAIKKSGTQPFCFSSMEGNTIAGIQPKVKVKRSKRLKNKMLSQNS